MRPIKSAHKVLDVQDLDQNLTNEYRQVNEDLPYIASLYGELINATRQGADVQPMNFNAQAYHDSKIYHVQDEMKKKTQNYLHYKQQQETVREMEKQREAEINRPWYQKAGSAVATFAGELSGHALNAYDQASRTLKVLSQSEKGINALLAANGITQAATGRDLFGKQLTKEEQKNSLLQGMFMMNFFKLGISPAQKTIVHEQGQAFKEHLSKIVHNSKASVSSSQWTLEMAEVPTGFTKMNNGAEDIAKAHRLSKSETNVAKVNEVSKNRVVFSKKTEVHGIGKIKGKSNHDRYTNRLDYLHDKFGIMSTSELHSEINKPQLRRMLENHSPSDYAKNWQGSTPYLGVDEYVDKYYSRGTVLYAGEPYPSGYFSKNEPILNSGKDAQKLFEGLQVKPFFTDGMNKAIYRKKMGAYRLNVDLKGANGFAKANPQFGKGGSEQIFMSDFQELLHNKFISRIDGGEIKLKNIEVSLDKYDEMMEKVELLSKMK